MRGFDSYRNDKRKDTGHLYSAESGKNSISSCRRGFAYLSRYYLFAVHVLCVNK